MRFAGFTHSLRVSKKCARQAQRPAATDHSYGLFKYWWSQPSLAGGVFQHSPPLRDGQDEGYLLRLGLLFTLLVAISGCQRGSAPASTAASTPTAVPFKVALLSPGPVSDAGWNALAYEGLLAIRDQLGAEVSQIQTKTPGDFEEGFRDFARRGYQLVFGHGFEFQDAAAAVAPDFPRTVFITTSGNTVRPNVAPLRFLLEEATYLEGMLAALMSKTGKAGVVGGLEIPSVKSTIIAFEAGARAVRPDFTVVTSYVGNWEDVGGAKEAALALVQQGCDFLFHNADAAGLGVFQAAQMQHVYAFGSNRNQNDVAPDVVIASAVAEIPRAFVQVAREVKEGRFEGRIERMGMKDGVIHLVLNPQLEAKIPAEVKQRIDEARETIVAGTLKVPTAEF
jgi:basic membrane lipoprotein Med (substrate-binding protein (PBP1-ABC) superfamily)